MRWNASLSDASGNRLETHGWIMKESADNVKRRFGGVRRPGNVGKQASAEILQPATRRPLLRPGTGALRRRCQDAPVPLALLSQIGSSQTSGGPVEVVDILATRN